MLGIRKGMVPSAWASVRLKNGGPARMASTERVVVTEILDKIFAEDPDGVVRRLRHVVPCG